MVGHLLDWLWWSKPNQFCLITLLSNSMRPSNSCLDQGHSKQGSQLHPTAFLVTTAHQWRQWGPPAQEAQAWGLPRPCSSHHWALALGSYSTSQEMTHMADQTQKHGLSISNKHDTDHRLKCLWECGKKPKRKVHSPAEWTAAQD